MNCIACFHTLRFLKKNKKFYMLLQIDDKVIYGRRFLLSTLSPSVSTLPSFQPSLISALICVVGNHSVITPTRRHNYILPCAIVCYCLQNFWTIGDISQKFLEFSILNLLKQLLLASYIWASLITFIYQMLHICLPKWKIHMRLCMLFSIYQFPYLLGVNM